MNIRAILPTLILCLAVASQAAENRPTKVFLLAGQSNMAGLGQAAELTPPFSEAFDQVKIWLKPSPQWNPLCPGMSIGLKNIGPEIHFGHAIASTFPNDDIRLIKHAKGGTSLYKDWSPESSGPQWLNLTSVADQALADLEKAGVKYEVAGMLWLQGESDAQEGKGAEYEANLRNFITRVREHFKTPGMPFIIARVRDFYGRENGNAKLVRDAQVKVAESTDKAAWFDTDDCTMFNQGHYDTAGQAVIGRRFADAFTKITAKPAK